MFESYLPSALKQFEYYESLGRKTIDAVPDEGLFWQPASESNNIAIIVGHLNGNMLSRWTDFLDSDGEKEWRQRDREFEPVLETREAVVAAWEEGWACVRQALTPLGTEDMDRLAYIRNQGHTVIEAINRQLGHYSYHVGQMVFLGKIYHNESWESLSIPKGKSSEFNARKFAEEKKRGHFTDDFLPPSK